MNRADVGHVLFDLDDTLVDHRAAAAAALEHAISRWSPDGTEHDLAEHPALAPVSRPTCP